MSEAPAVEKTGTTPDTRSPTHEPNRRPSSVSSASIRPRNHKIVFRQNESLIEPLIPTSYISERAGESSALNRFMKPATGSWLMGGVSGIGSSWNGPSSRTPGGARSTRNWTKGGAIMNDFGVKTIGQKASFIYLVNQIFGTGVIAVPNVFASCGWLPSLCANAFVCLSATLGTLMMLRCMTMVRGNRNFEKRLEYMAVMRCFLQDRLHSIVQCCFYATTLAQNVMSIVVVAQAADQLLVRALGATQVLQLYPIRPPMLFAVKEEIDEMYASADGQITFFISLGYILTAAVCIPLSLQTMEENMKVQYVSFAFLLLTLTGLAGVAGWKIKGAVLGEVTTSTHLMLVGTFLAVALCRPLRRRVLGAARRVPGRKLSIDLGTPTFPKVFGNRNYGELMSTFLASYSFVNVVPSWANEMTYGVDVGRAVVSSALFSFFVYHSFGYVMAFAYPKANTDNILQAVLQENPSVLASCLVYAFDLITVAPGILVFCITTRYNLLNCGVVDRRKAIWLGSVLPFLLAWIMSDNSRFSSVLTWSALVFSLSVNFLAPCLIFLVACTLSRPSLRNPNAVERIISPVRILLHDFGWHISKWAGSPDLLDELCHHSIGVDDYPTTVSRDFEVAALAFRPARASSISTESFQRALPRPTVILPGGPLRFKSAGRRMTSTTRTVMSPSTLALTFPSHHTPLTSQPIHPLSYSLGLLQPPTSGMLSPLPVGTRWSIPGNESSHSVSPVQMQTPMARSSIGITPASRVEILGGSQEQRYYAGVKRTTPPHQAYTLIQKVRRLFYWDTIHTRRRQMLRSQRSTPKNQPPVPAWRYHLHPELERPAFLQTRSTGSRVALKTKSMFDRGRGYDIDSPRSKRNYFTRSEARVRSLQVHNVCRGSRSSSEDSEEETVWRPAIKLSEAPDSLIPSSNDSSASFVFTARDFGKSRSVSLKHQSWQPRPATSPHILRTTQAVKPNEDLLAPPPPAYGQLYVNLTGSSCLGHLQNDSAITPSVSAIEQWKKPIFRESPATEMDDEDVLSDNVNPPEPVRGAEDAYAQDEDIFGNVENIRIRVFPKGFLRTHHVECTVLLLILLTISCTMTASLELMQDLEPLLHR